MRCFAYVAVSPLPGIDVSPLNTLQVFHFKQQTGHGRESAKAKKT